MRRVCGWLLVLCWLGCDDEAPAGIADGDDSGADAADAASDAGDAPSDPLDSGDTAVDVTTDTSPFLSNLSITENPINALSVYVRYDSAEAAPTQVHVTCGDDYDEQFTGESPVTAHEVFVMGLYEGAQCHFEALAGPDAEDAPQVLQSDYLVLSASMVLPNVTVNTFDADQIQPGWTLMNLSNRISPIPLHIVLIDEQGRYRWIHARDTFIPGGDIDTRIVPDGILVGGAVNIVHPVILDWQGKILWEGDFEMHHHIELDIERDELWYLSDAIDCEGEASLTGVINVIERESQDVVWNWRLCEDYVPDPRSEDWAHLNTITRYPDDPDLFLLSSRNQNAIMKVDRSTEQVLWVMGYGGLPEDGFRGDFTMEEGARFLQQHEPEFTADGHLVIFDNGMRDVREYSRSIELAFDEEAMTAELVWEFRPNPDIFAPIWGDADRLPNGNTLSTFGQLADFAVTHVIEATPESEVAWEFVLPGGWGVYRAERVVDPPMGEVLQ